MAKRDERQAQEDAAAKTPSIEAMWADLQSQGWEFTQTVNWDGDPYSAIVNKEGDTIELVWDRVKWENFIKQKDVRSAITKGWHKLNGKGE